MICFKCGRKGHKAACPYFPAEEEGEKQQHAVEPAMSADGERVQKKENNVYAGYLITWMIAESRKSRRTARTNPQNRVDAHPDDRRNHVSRFAALSPTDLCDNVDQNLEEEERKGWKQLRLGLLALVPLLLPVRKKRRIRKMRQNNWSRRPKYMPLQVRLKIGLLRVIKLKSPSQPYRDLFQSIQKVEI